VLGAVAAPAGAGVPFQLGKAKLNTKKGTATMAVEVPAKGKVSISTAKDVSHTEIFFDGPGQGKLPIKAKQGKPIQLLKANGKLKVNFTVTYAPQGPGQPPGGPTSVLRTVTLKLNR
jgi:hypothetical protein